MKIVDLEKQSSRKELESTFGGNVIVDFYVTWCGPCTNLAKSFSLLEAENKFDDLTVVKVNVDDHQDLAGEYNVRSLPTMVFIPATKKDHKTKVGSLSKVDLANMIRETYDYKK